MLSRLWRLAIAATVVAVVRVCLWTLPFARVERLVTRGRTWRFGAVREMPTHVAGRVHRIARFIPSASCLTRALATQILLAWQGQASTVRYGARHDAAGFAAHAWVEIDGRSLDALSSDYRPLHPAGVPRG
ncbi:MAG: lasso peptide biosynthesis B2 protein [Acidobacteria bacterium]|nr:lasso peptide biosynthesis B2 protein [Acidobacteriota bacterium]